MSYLKTFASAFKRVFSRPPFVVIAVFISLIVLAIGILLPNFPFVRFVLTSDLFSGVDRFLVLGRAMAGFTTVYALHAQIFLVLIALLAGINVALMTYYAKRRIATQASAGVGIIGIVGGFLGLGCSACGSVVLASLFGVGATAQIVGVLPFNGSEFNILSVGILMGANIYLAKKIEDPATCKIKV